MDKDQIVNEIYEAYGSDNGVLFGIKERDVVKAIVEFTLNRCNQNRTQNESQPSLTIQQGLDIWDAAREHNTGYMGSISSWEYSKSEYFASIGIDIDKL